MILNIYIAKRFFRAFLIVLAVFVSILLPIDLAEQAGRIASTQAGFSAALELALLNLPGALYEMMPLFVMLATLLMFLGLARTSELVVIRAAGRSALRTTMAAVGAAIALGLIGIMVVNPIVAATQAQYDASISRFQSGEVRTLSVSEEGLWLRQGNEERQTVIRANQANGDGTLLFEASFFTFSREGEMQQRIEGQQAALQDGAWVITGAKIWDLTVANAEAVALSLPEYILPSTLTPEQIRDSFGHPSTVPIYELPGFITQLNNAGFAALTHRVWLQMELSTPLMLVAMVLIGAGFTMRHTRFGRTGVMVLTAILLGFGVFFIRSFAQVLGESGQLPVLVVAWAPPLAAIMLALGLLLHTEDG